MKKALIFTMQNNPVEVSDREAISKGLENAGFSVTQSSMKELDGKTSEMPIEEYDLIASSMSFSAMFQSGGTRRTTIEDIIRRSKDGAFSIYVNDATIPLDPHIWDKADGHTSKINYLKIKPVRFLASFSKDFRNDERYEKFAHRFLGKSHPDSEIELIEWNAFWNEIMDDRADPLKRGEGLHEVEDGTFPIRYFYYGAKKSPVAKGLREMGLGDHSSDAVFGSIAKAKRLEGVRDVAPQVRPAASGPKYWLPIASQAEAVLVPYDPIKCDYQIIARFLESVIFYPENTIVDERVSEYLLPFLKSRDAWIEKSKSVSQELAELF